MSQYENNVISITIYHKRDFLLYIIYFLMWVAKSFWSNILFFWVRVIPLFHIQQSVPYTSNDYRRKSGLKMLAKSFGLHYLYNTCKHVMKKTENLGKAFICVSIDSGTMCARTNSRYFVGHLLSQPICFCFACCIVVL